MIDESDVDNNLPKTAILLKTDWGSKVYVVGTAHFSLKSQEDVAAVSWIHSTFIYQNILMLFH